MWHKSQIVFNFKFLSVILPKRPRQSSYVALPEHFNDMQASRKLPHGRLIETENRPPLCFHYDPKDQFSSKQPL